MNQTCFVMWCHWKDGHWKLLWNEQSEISSAVIKWQHKQKQLLKASVAEYLLIWCHPCNVSMKTEYAIINCIKVSPVEALAACQLSLINVWNSVAVSMLLNNWLLSLNCVPASQLPCLKQKSRIRLKASTGNGHGSLWPRGMLDDVG